CLRMGSAGREPCAECVGVGWAVTMVSCVVRLIWLGMQLRLGFLRRIECGPQSPDAIGRPFGLPAPGKAFRAAGENSVASLLQTTPADFSRTAMPGLRPQRRPAATAHCRGQVISDTSIGS